MRERFEQIETVLVAGDEKVSHSWSTRLDLRLSFAALGDSAPLHKREARREQDARQVHRFFSRRNMPSWRGGGGAAKNPAPS